MRSRHGLVRYVAALAVGAVSPVALAATIESAHVTPHGNDYDIYAKVHLDVSRAAAYAAATNYDDLSQYTPMIESTRRVGPDEFASTTRTCILWYCKTVHQVMRYSESPPGRLTMTVVPGAGDLKSGTMHWHFIPAGAHHCTLVFSGDVAPKFWVPPLVGSWAMTRALRQQISATAQAIESMAHQSSSGKGAGSS